MKGKGIRIKLILDLLMALLMLFEMASLVVGNMLGSALHEWMGVLLIALFIFHNLLNWRWYRALIKGKYTVRRAVGTIVNLLLMALMAMLMITGILFSREVFAFLPIDGGLKIRQFHTMAAHWGFLLISVHLGLHGGMIMAAFRRMFGSNTVSRPRAILLRIASLTLIALAIKAFFDREIGTKLIGYYAFSFWDPTQSPLRFVLDYAFIMSGYACGTHYILKWLEKLFNREERKHGKANSDTNRRQQRI